MLLAYFTDKETEAQDVMVPGQGHPAKPCQDSLGPCLCLHACPSAPPADWEGVGGGIGQAAWGKGAGTQRRAFSILPTMLTT